MSYHFFLLCVRRGFDERILLSAVQYIPPISSLPLHVLCGLWALPVGLDFLSEVNTLCVEDEELAQCIQELFVRQIGFQDGAVAQVLPDFITIVRGQFACCSYQRRALQKKEKYFKICSLT